MTVAEEKKIKKNLHLLLSVASIVRMDIFTKQDLGHETEPGKLALLEIEKMHFAVIILETRLRFGHIDHLVKPLRGDGEQWVEQHRITMTEK